MNLEKYIATISQRYKQGNTTEHSFRGDLQNLIEAIVPGITITNEPKRQSCGAPDYIITKKEIPIGFIEAKDIGDPDLSGSKKTGNKEQFDRYKASLGNLIFTDYLDFHLFRNGQLVTTVAIGEVKDGKIVPLINNFQTFTNLIVDFCVHVSQTIKSPKKLAEMMAGKARLLADIIEKALTSDVINSDNSTLKGQLTAFQQILLHDITPRGFADVYSQTIAYGMFAARLHDPTLTNFTRQEAAELIPKSNPFLRKLFSYIAGPDIDDRIKWVVDNLAEIFLACDVKDILKNYGKTTKMEDPIIHFYETFLTQYDPELRKSRGVWYTPHPVVNFIVRSVDDILKKDFGLKDGLADNTKTVIKVNLQETDKRYKENVKTIEEKVHRVQILDPATGTGTFLAEVVKLIQKRFVGQEGIWSKYLENDLLPRLNGFEILMASYAMAHLQLDLLLTESGYRASKEQRLRVYLTNSLEESHPDTGSLFANWLSSEANEANRIKRDTPVMCIIGNPPYSGESSNKGKWIMDLMADYKTEPGGIEKLKERNPKWINNDYVKFLRYGQYFIEKNGSGVLGFINPHGFMDDPTFRGMRWQLLKTYDKIYSIDLHGSVTKKETTHNGSIDENVFDIEQGVSINFLIKTGKKKANDLGIISHFDLYGSRATKYDFLENESLFDISFNNVSNIAPNYSFVHKSYEGKEKYESGFRVDKLFTLFSAGIVSANDSFLIDPIATNLLEKVSSHYNTLPNADLINKISYRPFDDRFIYYDNKLVERGRGKLMRHFLVGENIGLATIRINKENEFSSVFITKNIADARLSDRFLTYVFPLYTYPDNQGKLMLGQPTDRQPNFNTTILSDISKNLNLIFSKEKKESNESFSPIDILDYIYSVLHSPTYRIKYKQFLKVDFPRIPYPSDTRKFWKLVKLGKRLRETHLMENEILKQFNTQYPVSGDNIVSDIQYKDQKVYINKEQYFKNIPDNLWNFSIGGNQPAQKWLKDRKGNILEFDDVTQYQKIIAALNETNRLMNDIDKIDFL